MDVYRSGSGDKCIIWCYDIYGFNVSSLSCNHDDNDDDNDDNDDDDAREAEPDSCVISWLTLDIW